MTNAHILKTVPDFRFFLRKTMELYRTSRANHIVLLLREFQIDEIYKRTINIDESAITILSHIKYRSRLTQIIITSCKIIQLQLFTFKNIQ